MNEHLNHRELLIKKAKEDIETAESLIKLSNFSQEIVLFHCQQAVEKGLKAFLDAQNVIYPKTHDLETLLSSCIEKDKSFENLNFITSFTPYAVEIRYEETVSLSTEEVVDIVSQAKEALDFILSKC